MLLGANEVEAKEEPGVEIVASLPEDEGGHPLLVTGNFGNGRTLACTSDVGPHWLPATFGIGAALQDFGAMCSNG